MKKFFVILLLIGTVIVYAEGIKDYISSFKENNVDYLLNELSREKQLMEYENARITADSTIALIKSEIMHLDKTGYYLNTQKDLYKRFLNYLFNLDVTARDLNIKKLNYENAKYNYEKSQKLYNKNLISKIELLNAEYQLKNAKYIYDTINEKYNNIIDEFKKFCGISQINLNNIVVNEDKITKKHFDIKSLMNNDIDLKRQMLNYEILEEEFNATKDILSGFELKKKEIEFKKGQYNLLKVKNLKEKQINDLINRFNSLLNEIRINKLQQEYIKLQLKNAEMKLKNGLIEKTQYNQLKIDYLSTLNQITLKYNEVVSVYIDLISLEGSDFESCIEEIISLN
ncbi:hypothetical protein LN42_07435 [Marinitoga sp. 1137]|uniref:hypothetical protein n=1 Tax=Marinitoga sp. 1137 TaxID=1545835 RepID=UPI0009508064|nr:hypothetical protein [Marinitoga sp. 1137]APT76233.1 hypothetical protein LN42_07435 [Marinitoga sp. 1137]